MTLTDLLIFALGAGLGLCVGWMLGSIAGHRVARAERPVSVWRTQRVFLPTDYLDELEEPSCVMPPPAPSEPDWEDGDFERRTALREEIEAARPAGGLGYRDRPRGFGY